MVIEKNGYYIDEFHCDENMMHYWHNRLESLQVNTPKTEIFYINEGEPDFALMYESMVENDWDHAFLRADNFSDKINPRTGSHISKQCRDEIKRTYETLKNHLINHMNCPLGDYVAMREWIDLKYCKKNHCTKHHPNEIRFFIKNGDIQYVTPSPSMIKSLNLSHNCTYDYLCERLENGIPEIKNQIIKVANEFTEYSWHVDFCLSTDLNWYCIDMGLNGIYWNKMDEKWVPMSGHEQTKENIMREKINDLFSNGPIY